MSRDADRIAVPTNGKGPHPLPPTPETPPATADERSAPPLTAPFSPTQLAVGLGIVAAVLALVAGSLRRRARGRHGPFGR